MTRAGISKRPRAVGGFVRVSSSFFTGAQHSFRVFDLFLVILGLPSPLFPSARSSVFFNSMTCDKVDNCFC